MKIAVVGAGAMGSIFGGNLSKKNEVFLIDVNKNVVNIINKDGLKINENGEDNVYYPKAFVSAENIEEADLVILFVKTIHSRIALESTRKIIGENTYLLTLQNGGGHEALLKEFANEKQIIIGTTEDNGHVLGEGYIKRGGTGVVNIGMPFSDDLDVLKSLAINFDNCGFKTRISNNIMQIIWDKLSINDTLSIVTGLLQCRMGYISESEYAWNLVKMLAIEFVQVASSLNLKFNVESILENVKQTSIHSKNGITSICADIRAKRKTEVDSISGYVLETAHKFEISVPVHSFIVNAIHALENRE